MQKKILIFIMPFLVFILIYTRFIGLQWGNLMAFHPDENNMVSAIARMGCPTELTTTYTPLEYFRVCMNPHFFAYGQPPLYISFIVHDLFNSIDPRLVLRVISALASIGTVLVALAVSKKLLPEYIRQHWWSVPIIFLFLIFSPYAIQFAHFGTTESMLMFLYVLLLYLHVGLIEKKYIRKTEIAIIAFILGLAVAIKISSVSYIIFTLYACLATLKYQKKLSFSRRFKIFCIQVISIGILSGLFFVFFSPHNIISFKEFIGSVRYEISVGNGSTRVFYTRQFEHSIPYLFQGVKVFPFALGIPQFMFAVVFLLTGNIILISEKKRRIYRMIVAGVLLYFIPAGYLYTKWTRFLAPIFPFFSISAGVFVVLVYSKYIRYLQFSFSKVKYTLGIVFLLCTLIVSVLPGVAYMSIYLSKDVRVVASEWMYNNIPADATIVQEAGNVINLPVYTGGPIKNFNHLIVDMYEADTSLSGLLISAEYVIVPSRRVVNNHTCIHASLSDMIAFNNKRCDELRALYPELAQYYVDLLASDKFIKIAEISSYPRIGFLEYRDENAEETWSVFDHPVIRIYKRL